MRPSGAARERRDVGAEARVADLAARQHGVVARRQLIACGLTDPQIHARRRRGLLHRLDPPVRGTYLVGHPAAMPLARQQAVLLTDPTGRTVISGPSAAHLHQVLAPPDVVHVITNARTAPRRPGVVGRCGIELPADQIWRIGGLAVTSPARTLLDLAAFDPSADLASVLDRLRIRRLATDREILECLETAGPARGVGAVRALMATERCSGFSRSKAERMLRALVLRAGLPEPERNVGVLGRERDLVWPDDRVVVEFDGYAFHRTPRAFAADRARDAELVAAGWRSLRITWPTLVGRPELVAAQLGAVLAGSTRRASR